MSFKNWVIRKLGGYTATEMAEMETIAHREYNKLKVELNKAEQQIATIETQVNAETVSLQESITLSSYEMEIPEAVERAKEDVGRAIGEFMCANNLIHFNLDRDFYKDTTQSVVISGNARVLR